MVETSARLSEERTWSVLKYTVWTGSLSSCGIIYYYRILTHSTVSDKTVDCVPQHSARNYIRTWQFIQHMYHSFIHWIIGESSTRNRTKDPWFWCWTREEEKSSADQTFQQNTRTGIPNALNRWTLKWIVRSTLLTLLELCLPKK